MPRSGQVKFNKLSYTGLSAGKKNRFDTFSGAQGGNHNAQTLIK